MRTRSIAILVVALYALGVAEAWSAALTTDTVDFTVVAEPGTWKGRPTVQGYIVNKRSWRATRVLLRVESLDASGAVLASGIRHLDRDVPLSDRVYFDVPPPVPAATYRVTVEYVFWRDRSGGG